MKIFYFEQHPQKNYLWRLTPAAYQKFSRLIDECGFCSAEYYTKELSNQMYCHIKEAEASKALRQQNLQTQSNVINMNDVALRYMFSSILINDHKIFLQIKKRFI